jgi:hypothetical protein
VTSRADGGANARHELNEVRAGLARALAAVERLKAHGGLSPLALDVASMLASDVAMAGKREQWIRAALERRGAA